MSFMIDSYIISILFSFLLFFLFVLLIQIKSVFGGLTLTLIVQLHYMSFIEKLI